MSALTGDGRRHGPYALSARTRRRLLNDLHRRALEGDAAAAGELIRLGMEFGHDAVKRRKTGTPNDLDTAAAG
jgi:hypothetical protein